MTEAARPPPLSLSKELAVVLMGNIGEGKTLDEFLAETLKQELGALGEVLDEWAGEAELLALLEAVRLADLALLESLLD